MEVRCRMAQGIEPVDREAIALFCAHAIEPPPSLTVHHQLFGAIIARNSHGSLTRRSAPRHYAA